jgi:glycosyltransferase involved in cell wall biosynthesis
VVVADTSSSDNTVRVAGDAGAEVVTIPFDGFGAAKNRALEYCRGDWVLSIDADERVSPELASSIVAAVRINGGPDCYAINRLSHFLGKPIRHSGWFPDYVVRLFRRGLKFSNKRVHESVEATDETGKLDGLLYHYSYRSIDQYVEKLNVYTSLNAEELFNNGKRGSLFDLFIHPTAVFFKMYFFKAGFLDGKTGLMLAALSSCHVFVKYAKLLKLREALTK